MSLLIHNFMNGQKCLSNITGLYVTSMLSVVYDVLVSIRSLFTSCQFVFDSIRRIMSQSGVDATSVETDSQVLCTQLHIARIIRHAL